MNPPTEAATPVLRKLSFKVTRRPVAEDAQTQDNDVTAHSLPSPISLVSPAPITAVPRTSRFVVKSSASPSTILPRYDDSPTLARVTPQPSPQAEIMDVEPRTRRRQYDMEVDMAPTAKRRKEVEQEDELVDISGHGGQNGAPRKRWVPLRKMLNNAMKKLIDLDGYKFFYEPVTAKDAPDYFTVIKKPMDFVTMRRKLNEDKYPYWNLFVEDFELICQNCITYNLPNSIYWNEAKTLLLEGKKYLKQQATKINPDLLTAPPNFDASTPGFTPASAAQASNSDLFRTVVPTLEMPQRIYLRNDELPLHLLAPPPPVHLAKLPKDAAPKRVFNPIDEIVAKETPQQQRLQKTSPWQRFLVEPPTTRSHWSRSIPNYISYTRGYPGNTKIISPTLDILSSDARSTQEHTKKSAASSHSRLPPSADPHRSYYLDFYSRMQGNNTLAAQQHYHRMTDDEKHKFQKLSDLLRSDPHNLPTEFLSPEDIASKAMEMDTSALIPSSTNLLTLTPQEAADLKSLRSTLESSHLDLSFLDNVFTVESAPQRSLASTLGPSEILARNSQLIQLLNASTQTRRANGKLSDTEATHLQELTENLVMLVANTPPNTFAIQGDAIEQVRLAVELGLPSVPDVTPSPLLGIKDE